MTLKTSLPDMRLLEEKMSGNLPSYEASAPDELLSNCEQLYHRYLVHINSNLHKKADTGSKVYLSSVDDLALDEFVVVRKLYCKLHHGDSSPEECHVCAPLICLAEKICDEGLCELSALYRAVFPNIRYQSDKAIRRLMQLPVAIFRLELSGPGSQRLYVSEIRKSLDYDAFTQLCQKALSSKTATRRQEKGLNKETLDLLCQLATTESDRCLIKYSVCKSQGLSAKQAKKDYGFTDLHGKEDKIMNAVQHSQAIRDAVMKLASVKHKATLKSLGYEIVDDSENSSSDSEHSSCDQLVSENEESEDEFSGLSEKDNSESNATVEVVSSNSDTERDIADVPIDPDVLNKENDNTMIVDLVPSMDHLLFMLRANELNWFSFVEELRMLLKELTPEALNQVLLDFAYYLSSCDVNKEEERLIEQSRQAYLECERQRVMDSPSDDDIVSDPESDNPNDWVEIDDLTSKNANDMVLKQWKIRKRRAQVNAAKAIAQAGLLKRKVTKRVSGILHKYPSIGKDIESFVSENKIGADAWRRTGVLTFSYGKNQSSGQKVTYKRIKEHLEKKYKRKFSHGTIVQLCVARNKRRISAKRYKGAAKVTCRRARKGFALKLNPDAHYSCAMYSGLDHLQKKEGTVSLLLNRDDAAGFRLDSTFTHRQHSTLSLSNEVEVTTRCDYVNKYSSTLQVSSYMFLETETTPEVCIGVVKAPHLHQKSPVQHMADLRMLQEHSEFKHLFQKKVEFIRVDGSTDEGPSHYEVQFMWTERHLTSGSECVLVTTRHSGGSYLNKVELLNGCLAKGHSHLFIPSTIGGAVNSNEQLDKNLNLAIDYYIKRVNGAPCGNGTITLLKGSSSEFAKHASGRRQNLLTFLRGNKRDKEDLKQREPTMYAYFEEVWDVRNRHLVQDLPSQYVFMLIPCLQEGCPHKICKEGGANCDLKWFSDGPPLDYFPIPIPDPNRPWGGDCSQCQGTCNGHFLPPSQHLENYQEHGKKDMMSKPPSKIIGAAHKKFLKKKGKPSKKAITDLAKETLLSEEDVRMWLDHLDEVRKNRVEGAAKRKAKSSTKGSLN